MLKFIQKLINYPNIRKSLVPLQFKSFNWKLTIRIPSQLNNYRFWEFHYLDSINWTIEKDRKVYFEPKYIICNWLLPKTEKSTLNYEFFSLRNRFKIFFYIYGKIVNINQKRLFVKLPNSLKVELTPLPSDRSHFILKIFSIKS